ncbi:DNA circularization N-terminal domain-containing protein [Sphingomonas sp. BE137]|uniref:DNA circularization protein n=1 Tax=Sphingomonas sp. BE137 TaxID=2817844 RepID=UPI001AE7C834|nr:DNA circularization N-terminal domain-containing protein [Sphingomonas sp. BE137]
MALPNSGLLPASFRGVPFVVTNDEIGGGRRQVVHQYPGRDDPWTEDMGREARRFRFRGFILDGSIRFAGGPVQLQRSLLIAALERSGAGMLTHPTLGILQVCVTRFNVGQELDAGRKSSVDIEFVESGKRNFPSILSSSSGLLSAANLGKLALAVDGVRLIALAAAAGGRRQDMRITAASWSSKAIALSADATSLHRLTAQLPGNYGRFSAGGNAGFSDRTSVAYSAGTTVATLIGVASGARVGIAAAAQALMTAVSTTDLGYAQDVASSIVAMVQALADACADPADAIRLLEQLLGYDPGRTEATTAIGLAVCGMVRRAAASSLVIAAGQYQPTSANDAAAMVQRLVALIDAEATIAADAGDRETYSALTAALGAVVRDLRARGANLAQVRTFRSPRATPAIVLAQRWYRDPTRAAQLVTQSGVPSPLFMPTELLALSA